MSSALTTVGEAAMERNIADKERLLLQLQQQAAALASEINSDQVRLSTSRSGAGRRPRTSVQGAHSFTPHSFGPRHQIGSHRSRASQASTEANSERPVTAVSQSLAPFVEGQVEQLSFDRPMTGISTYSRPATSSGELMGGQATTKGANLASMFWRRDPEVSGQNGTRVRLSQMHEFTKDNRRKIQGMFVLADPHGSMKLSMESMHNIYSLSGFDISLAEFQSILEAMGTNWREPIDYADFFSHLTILTKEIPEVFEAQSSLAFAPSQMFRILSRRLTDRYDAALRQLKFEDTEGNGQLTRPQLLRVIRATQLQFSEAQLDELLEKIELLPLNTLDANKFLKIFVPHHLPTESVDSGMSIRMPNAPKEMSAAPTMTTEELKTALQQKLQIAFETTREMFFAMDTRKVGTITKQDFLKTFQRLGLFPREKQVEELFRELDIDRKGRLDYLGFLARFAPKPLGANRTQNPTKPAEMDPYEVAREKLRTEASFCQRPATATAVQMQQAVQSKMSLPGNLERAETFFRAHDTGLVGKLNKDQALQVLRKFDIFMTNAQFDDMLIHLKFPRASLVDYMQLLQVFGPVSRKDSLDVSKAAATPVLSPLRARTTGLNMLQARSEKARQSLERVSQSSQAAAHATATAFLQDVKDRQKRQKLFSATSRWKEVGTTSRSSPRVHLPQTAESQKLDPVLLKQGGQSSFRAGPKSRLEKIREGGVTARGRLEGNCLGDGGGDMSSMKKDLKSEKDSFSRIKRELARQWEAFQAAFFLLQEDDEYFKVPKDGFRRLIGRYSIECSPSELDMLWRKLTPISRHNLQEGKGGGIDYFDLIRVFGSDRADRSKPAYQKTVGAEVVGLKALAMNAAKPFNAQITHSWDQSFSDRWDPATGSHSGKQNGSRILYLQ